MKNCRKGKSCGRSCISKAKTCRKAGGGAKTKTKACPSRPPRSKPRAKDATAPKTTACRERIGDVMKASGQAATRKAYLKASLKCHPDKGGSTKDFQCLQWHYDKKRGVECGDKPDGCPSL
jgi:hypothetical protein